MSIKLRVLGCDGGRGLGYNTTSLLFNDHVLIDAGTIQTRLTLDEALAITDIFFTHAHLDHIIDLPFLLDATFEKREKPLRLHGTKEALDALMRHIFNDEIWPNFARLPSPDKGQFELHEIVPGQTYNVDGLELTPFAAEHTVPTVGYCVASGEAAVVFSGDSGPNSQLWEMANNEPRLKAVIVDLSFPNAEQKIADISGHMTAKNVADTLAELTQPCDVYAFHFKVGLSDVLHSEMATLTHHGKPVRALRDAELYTFK